MLLERRCEKDVVRKTLKEIRCEEDYEKDFVKSRCEKDK